MRTIAQYSIRDPNGQDAQLMISEEPAGRTSTSISGMMRTGGPPSVKGSMGAGSTLGLTTQMNNLNFHMSPQELPGQPAQMSNFAPPHAGVSELPVQNPRASYYPQDDIPEIGGDMYENDRTPTDARASFLPHLNQGGPMDYSPIDRKDVFDENEPGNYQNSYHPQQQQFHIANAPVPDILRPGPVDDKSGGHTQSFYSDSTPYHSYADQQDTFHGQEPQWTMSSQHDSRGAYEGGYDGEQDSAYNTHGGYNGAGGYDGGGNTPQGGGGLRVANRDSSDSDGADDSWRRDALAQMNFVGSNAGHAQGNAQGGQHHAA